MIVDVKFESVSKQVGDLFGMKGILHDVSFAVRRGSVCGLIGHNGAGKSTLMRLAIGLSRPTRGTIRLFDQDPRIAGARRGLGYAAETPAFPATLTAEELIQLHASLLGVTVDPMQILARAGLATRPGAVSGFSKGMRQRLALALSTIGSPQVLVLDEPMSGLDPVGRAQVRTMILEEKKRGATILFSSHVLSDVAALCDHLLVLRHGRVVLDEALGDNAAADWTLTYEAGADFSWCDSLAGVMHTPALCRVDAQSPIIWNVAQQATARGLRVLSVLPGQLDLERRILPLLEQEAT